MLSHLEAGQPADRKDGKCEKDMNGFASLRATAMFRGGRIV